MAVKIIRIQGVEYPNLTDAIQGLNFHGEHVIRIGGKCLTITDAELARLQGMGYQPTTWHYSEAFDRIMSVPGNME